jgi:hypothetical protein
LEDDRLEPPILEGLGVGLQILNQGHQEAW